MVVHRVARSAVLRQWPAWKQQADNRQTTDRQHKVVTKIFLLTPYSIYTYIDIHVHRYAHT
jgi:hypothetical protein